MSNKTEEALRREVIREVRWYSNTGTADQISRFTSVRAAFDAYDKAVIAASKPITHRWNIELDGDDLLICDGSHDKGEECKFVRYARVADRPTFEGDEVNVRAFLLHLMEEWPINAKLALALLDAKDERLASAAKWNDLYANARDEALARAERAEQALADRDAAIVEVTNRAAEWKHTGNCCTSTANYVVEPLRPFLPAPEPGVDPLAEIITDLWDFDHRAAAELRAAIERAGGVKAVFGEGV